MPWCKADVFEIILLPARSNALLASHRSKVRRFPYPCKKVLELNHPCICKKQRRVPRRKEARRGDVGMSMLDKVGNKTLADRSRCTGKRRRNGQGSLPFYNQIRRNGASTPQHSTRLALFSQRCSASHPPPYHDSKARPFEVFSLRSRPKPIERKGTIRQGVVSPEADPRGDLHRERARRKEAGLD